YRRLIGSLMGGLKKEGLDNEYLIKYIPFGARRSITIYDDYNNFSENIKTNFSTTDFIRLNILWNKVQKNDSVIIISDGEHDTSSNPPFTNLTEDELKEMIDIASAMSNNRHPIYVIHILKEYSGERRTLDIGSYYRNLKNNRSNVLAGVKFTVGDGNVIAALSKDFMKKIAKTANNYYLCYDNKGAVEALFKIFNITMPIACNTAAFKKNIPLNVMFNASVSGSFRQWFWQELKNKQFCLDGVNRAFENDPNNNIFRLSVDYVNRDAYTVRLGNDIIWKERKIYESDDMAECLNRVVTNIKTMITGVLIDDVRFSVPECLISVKFMDEKIYTFLGKDNFQLYLEDCGSSLWQNADIYFFEEDKRAYIPIPMMKAQQLRITAPGQENAAGGVKTITLNSGVTGSWDAEELTVSESDLQFPSFSYNFSDFFSQFKGTLLFFSAATKRFYGLVSSDQPQASLKIFKDLRYQIYYVPENLGEKNIKMCLWEPANETDVPKALALLIPTPEDVVFGYWEECLRVFQQAKRKDALSINNISTTRSVTVSEKVAHQISQSNGYFQLLYHLGDIKADPRYKELFIALLEQTIKECQGINLSFKIVELFQARIPGFSDRLKQQYLKMGYDKEKLMTIIQVLSNPISNLSELNYYLNGDITNVSLQNYKYFRELDD
ncbi:MAG: hypothetical protein MUF15_21925, partial [Acidobacteria bacterium]|nr:hypothetical protein [Acidobacteriota bacterium]